MILPGAVRLASPGGLTALVLPRGATLAALEVPGRDGRAVPMILAHAGPDGWREDRAYLGALVGRFANRIANGRFMLDGTCHRLDRNERGRTTLHGGSGGFSTRDWRIAAQVPAEVTLALTSLDGDQGFPGRVEAEVRYALDDAVGGLVVEVSATADRPTPVSLAQHAYFTLGAADVRTLALQVLAEGYTPVDAEGIPTGAIAAVAGTPLDFRSPRAVGAAGGRLDHNFSVGTAPNIPLRPVARVANPATGAVLTVLTTQPGLQVYDGAMLPAGLPGRHGPIGPHAGLCLETQAFPDAPNHPDFPDAILRPGECYLHRTEYAFGWRPPHFR